MSLSCNLGSAQTPQWQSPRQLKLTRHVHRAEDAKPAKIHQVTELMPESLELAQASQRPAAAAQTPVLDQIVERLSADSQLILPQRVQRECKDGKAPERTKSTYLQQVISRDPSIFLERHGHLLTQPELEAFEPLAEDYEVRFYLQRLKASKPSQASVKNR